MKSGLSTRPYCRVQCPVEGQGFLGAVKDCVTLYARHEASFDATVDDTWLGEGSV